MAGSYYYIWGFTVRTKVKEVLDLLGDDDSLREGRKEARKLKDKFVGVSGGYGECMNVMARPYCISTRPYCMYI